MKKGDIEFRWSDTNNSYELVKWNGKTCFVIAFFRKEREGYNLETAGDRFFMDKDAWFMGKQAMAFLEALHEEEDET